MPTKPDDEHVLALPPDPEGEAEEARVMEMSEEEFARYMTEGEDGLAFGA